jgi:hypothetical protein
MCFAIIATDFICLVIPLRGWSGALRVRDEVFATTIMFKAEFSSIMPTKSGPNSNYSPPMLIPWQLHFRVSVARQLLPSGLVLFQIEQPCGAVQHFGNGRQKQLRIYTRF